VSRTPPVGLLVALCFLSFGGASSTAQTLAGPSVVVRGLSQPREVAVAPNGDLYFTQVPAVNVVTLSRLPSGSANPIQVYRLSGTGAWLGDIHFDDAGKVFFVTRSGSASTLTRLDPANRSPKVLVKADTGSLITLDAVTGDGSVYFVRATTDPQTKARTADLLRLGSGSSTASELTHFAGAAHADAITFLTLSKSDDVYFVESPAPDAASTLYQLTQTGRRVVLRGAVPGRGFNVAAAAFDASGNLEILRTRFAGFTRVGCASSTTMRISRATATALTLSATPALQTVSEGSLDGYVGLWVDPNAYWPSSATFRVDDAGDTYWLQSPVQSRCGSNPPEARLADDFVGVAATGGPPTVLFDQAGQKPIAGVPGCCPPPMGIATNGNDVYLAAADKILDFVSVSRPPPQPTGVAMGTVMVDGKPFVGGQIKYGWTIDVSTGMLNLNTDVGELTLYGQGGTHSELLMSRPDASKLDLDLIGGDFSVCGKRALASADKKKKTKVRLLWAKGKGHFRTAGRDSIASVHGTTWLTMDRCDGTLTVVKDGIVSVRDLHRRKTVNVRAGHSYLAKHGARR
jgi:hypothetical protein